MGEYIVFFIEGARLKTLPAILSPIAMSSAWAFYQTGFLKKDILFWTALSASCIQISANLFNDALDYKQGVDSHLRKGPKRLSQTGKLSFSQIQNWAIFTSVLAVLAGVPLILRGGWPILILGIVSCVLAYLYTGTKFSLLRLGLSELFCFLFFGPIAVFGTYYLQSLHWDMNIIYLGIPCGLWSLSLLLINHLRDEKEDRAGGRRHFVTLYGRTHALFFLTIAQAFIYLICFFWMGQGLKSGALSFFVMPFSALLIYFIASQASSSKYNSYLALCSLLYTVYSGLWIVGLWI